MTALLEARGITQVFGNPARGGVVALDNLTLLIDDDAPSFTAVVGESGSGKTTLARILLGFQTPSRGAVLYRGVDLRRASPGVQHEFRREVQAIFQDPFAVYNPFYKVDHLLKAPIRNFGLAHSSAQARALIEQALSAVGLRPEETLGRYPHQLSGGQRQRITVARALLLKPRLIIADEPVSMVDASLRATILESLRTLNLEYGISFIYITHDLTTAYQVSDNVMVLYRGRVAEAGAAATVIKRPQHPYTQLLVASIPLPDPERPWGEHVALARDDGQRGTSAGCAFADRCPFVMTVCRERPPALFRTEPYQAATCYLYGDRPALRPEDDIATVFRQRAGATRQPGADTAS